MTYLDICEVFNSTLCEFAMAEFADNGSLTNILAEGETKAKKRKRSIQAIRKKRIKRNLAKKEEHKKMTKQERRKKLTLGLQDKVNDLQRKLYSSKHLYKKEKRISAYCWRKWKEDNRVAVQTQSGIKRITRTNLISNESSPAILGQGCFGKCVKMKYRDITVAVKKYETFVTPATVLLEASVINKFDHPGLPLFLGISICEEPLLLVTQFHGVDGNCITLSKAKKQSLVEEVGQYISVFTDIADALDYVHGKGYLHNDIKGDNVLLTKDSIYHGVLIDFGKSRKVKHAKMYKLKTEEQAIYRKKYWHIAPELVKGTHKQSFESDVYSFGIMLKYICYNNGCNMLKRIINSCVHENPIDRPTLKVLRNELCKLLK